MKIVLAIDHLHPRKGGAERSLCRILTALAERGHDVAICAMSWQQPEGANWQFHRVKAPPWPRWCQSWWFARRAEDQVQRLAPDLVLGVRHVLRADVFLARGGLHCETLAANRQIQPARLADQFRHLQPKHRMMLALERRLFLKADAPLVISPSQKVRQQFLTRFGLQADRVVVVRTGIDLNEFKPAGADVQMKLREDLGLGNRVVGLFVAHNFALKGLPCLLKAWRGIDPVRFQLLVAGRGRAPGKAGQLPNVTYLGDCLKVRDLFQAGDFLVHPTFYDPFSRVVIEGLACGLPVITTRQNGAAEIMRDGHDGFILNEPTQLDRLRECITSLGEDSRRADISRAARQTAERYPESEFLERTVQFLEEAAVRKTRRLKERRD